MKKLFIAALILAVALPFAGCAKMQIENAIQDFEDAVNDDDQSALDSLLSDDSIFRATAPTSIEAFLDYFDGFRPVSYSSLDIDVDGSSADVNANVNYSGIPEDAFFVMSKEGGDWKVKEYWDTAGGSLEFIWHKIRKLMEKKIAD